MRRYKLTVANRQQGGIRIPEYMICWDIHDAETGQWLGMYGAMAYPYWNGLPLVPIDESLLA